MPPGINAHGAWTETFLVEGLERHGPVQGGRLDLVELFQDAYRSYIQRHTSRGDRPCCFLRVGDKTFNTNCAGEEPDVLPRAPRGCVCSPHATGPSGMVFARDIFGLP